MIARVLILTLALHPASPVLAAQSGEDRMRTRTGVACDRSTREPLYRELHEEGHFQAEVTLTATVSGIDTTGRASYDPPMHERVAVLVLLIGTSRGSAET